MKWLFEVVWGPYANCFSVQAVRPRQTLTCLLRSPNGSGDVIGKALWERFDQSSIPLNFSQFTSNRSIGISYSKGTVIRAFRDLIPTASISSDEPVLVQQYVEFVSEWHASILRDKILHIGDYRGDPLVFPDANVAKVALKAIDDRPISFGMDWGITRSGQTLLVEVNDGFSLGNYGLRGGEYTALIEARWRQLMGLPDNGVGEIANG
jgi:hypothetical protein